MTAFTVEISPVGTPAAASMLWISVQVVVLPSVPVTPMITSLRAGKP